MKTSLKQFLNSKGCYSRPDPRVTDESIARLGVTPGAAFAEFYHDYEGAFGSDFTGYILSDVVRGDETSIVGATEYFRENETGWIYEHLVISDMCAHAVLVYDCITDRVYNVDFEGGSDRLKEGTLEPQWSSFEDFLDFYFLGVGSEN